jgi:hypothetical protein
MKRTRLMQTAAAAAVCAIVASVIGITTGAAAPSDDDNGNGSDGANGAGASAFPGSLPAGAVIALRSAHPGKGGPVLDHVGPAPIGGPPVHSEMVVPTRNGEDFETVTQDSGTVKSVSGDELTITEGTEEATYRTVTLEIPADAKVVRNGEDAELGDLKAGDRVHVSQSSDGSFVFATDGEYFEEAIKRLRDLPGPPRLRDLPRPPRAGGLPPGLPMPMVWRGS